MHLFMIAAAPIYHPLMRITAADGYNLNMVMQPAIARPGLFGCD
jgi:hypothetical protein